MRKKDAYGQWVQTCFFGDCAQNPEGGRLNRDGPDFISKDELLEHLWTEQGSRIFQKQFCSHFGIYF